MKEEMSSRNRQYCYFKDILVKKKKKRKSKIQKLHILCQKKHIVEKPSPFVNLSKKTTTYIKTSEKKRRKVEIKSTFSSFSPLQPTILSKNQKQRKGKDRKIHLILSSTIKKTFCRSKQNEKKKKEEKMQNDTSLSASIEKTFIRRNQRRENARDTRLPSSILLEESFHTNCTRKQRGKCNDPEDTCHPSQREHNEETKSRIACAISPDSKDVPCILKVRGDVVSSIWPFVSPRKYATMPALCAARLSSMFAK